MEFKLGDRVKFKDYEEYSDWRRHRGQVAEISMVGFDDWDYRVKWADGGESGVGEDNLVLVGKEVFMKDAKFGLSWEENDDPIELFETEEDRDRKVEELLDDPDVNKKRIFRFKVTDVEMLVVPRIFKWVKECPEEEAEECPEEA